MSMCHGVMESRPPKQIAASLSLGYGPAQIGGLGLGIKALSLAFDNMLVFRAMFSHLSLFPRIALHMIFK